MLPTLALLVLVTKKLLLKKFLANKRETQNLGFNRRKSNPKFILGEVNINYFFCMVGSDTGPMELFYVGYCGNHVVTSRPV